MEKGLIWLPLLAFFSWLTWSGWNEYQKIEIYCDLMSSKKFLGTEEILTINYGDRDSLWIDKKMYNSFI